MTLSTTFNQLEVNVSSRHITFQSSAYVRALNGLTFDGQLACSLASGQRFTVDTSYDVLADFHNCSTVNGGFSVSALSTTVGLTRLFFYHGNNGPCGVLYGPLSSPTTGSALLPSDTLSVGGAVYVRLGEPSCQIGSECPVPSFSAGICDSEVGDNAEVTFGRFGISVTDPDGLSNTALSYSIVSGNEQGFFSIDRSNGNLSLVREVDRDIGNSEFTLVVSVADGQFNASLVVMIQVLDENDNDPIPSMTTFAGSVDEGLPINTYVLTAVFTDQDVGLNALLRYSIVPTSPDFIIFDPSVGNISTNRVFDFESGDVIFTFEINARDSSIVPRVGTASVMVTINDVNDNRPTIQATSRNGFIEDFGPVVPASVSVSDADSNDHPQLYAVVTIVNPLDGDTEVLGLPSISLPRGFKIGYHNFTLIIVGPGPPDLYTDILSNITYDNSAILFQQPLSRTISYGVCDMLGDGSVLSLLTSDTQRAFNATASDSDLPDSDAQLLLISCLQLISSEVAVDLIETNDRPVLVDFLVEFPPISEDFPLSDNHGSFVIDVFGNAIVDTDRNSVTGIAIIGQGGPATGQFGTLMDDLQCRSAYDNISSMGESGCGGGQLDGTDFCECPPPSVVTCVASSSAIIFACVNGRNAKFCTCSSPLQQLVQTSLPEFSTITTLEINFGGGSAVDISTNLNLGIVREYVFISSEQFSNFTLSISTLIATLSDRTTVVTTIPSFVIIYQNIDIVTRESAVVLGPYNLIRWVPIHNLNGRVVLVFRGWDASNGVPFGSRNIDTTLSNDTSFSLEDGNATVEVFARNDPPVIRLSGRGEDQLNYSTVYTEGGPSIFVSDRDAVVIEFDTQDLFLSNLIVAISGVGGICDLPNYPGNSNDSLSYLNTTMVSLSEVRIQRFGQACITYSFLGTMSVDNWRSFLTMIRFSVSDQEPSDHPREIAFTISDASSTSAPAYTTITLVLVSDICPEITLASSGPVTYREHSTPVVLDSALVVTDGDRSPLISSASVQIVSTPNDPCSSCELRVLSPLPSGVISRFDQSIRTLTFTGNAGPSQYQDLLRSVAFVDTGNEPSFNLVMVRFTVRDPTLTSCQGAMADIGVMIEHINDNSPTIYLNYPTSQDYSTTFTEGMASVSVTGQVRINDPDGSVSESYRVDIVIQSGCQPSEDRLELPVGSLSTVLSPYNQVNCSLELEGNLTALEQDLSLLIYRNIDIDDPSPTLRSIVFTVTDGVLPSNSSQTSLTVIPVNDIPRIDLNVANPVSSDAMRQLTDVSVPIVDTGGGSISDPDNEFLVRLTLVLSEIDSAGNQVVPRTDQAFEILELAPPVTLSQFGLSGTFISQTSQFVITGVSSVSNYTTVLNSIMYSNRRLPPSDSNIRRRVVVSVADNSSISDEVTSTITLQVSRNPPMLDLNGEPAGINVDVTYTLTNPPLVLFPTAFLRDLDEDNICNININMSGSDSTCQVNNIDFTNAYSDITVNSSDMPSGANYFLSSRFTDCREAIVFQDVLRGVRFSGSDTTTPGNCSLSVTATDARGVTSIPPHATATIQVRAFNAAPFIDLDRGLSGRDFSTVYFQNGLIKHIVSIFNATTARNITEMTVVGEAADMAAEAPPVPGATDNPSSDDGTFFHGVVIMEESNAGFILRDMDSPTLSYLQVEFFAGSNLENDVISFPCEAAQPIPPYGCNSSSSAPVTFLAPRCNNSVFSACTLPNAQDVCSDLQVTIFCSAVGRKGYRFEYLRNALTTRYETLLGLLGYDFLLPTGGQISQIRLLNITVFDSLSGMINPLAITRVRVLNQDVPIIELDPPFFIVYEDERPNRTCNLYTLRVRLRDGTVPPPSDVIYNISQGNINMPFDLRDDGVIFLNNRVDREVISGYNLTITARIRTSPLNAIARAQLTANVIDVNDNHPTTADSYTVNVTEGMPGARVVQVIATDADEGDNAILTYLLLGIGSENFQVDSNGLVTTRVALNRTLVDYYLLVMIIMDRGDPFLSTHTVINVMVITPAATQLAFNPFSPFMVRENTAVGTPLQPSLSAFEVDGEGDTTFIRYRFIEILSDRTGLRENPDPFIIDSTTGVISVNSNLDSERSSNYSAVVEAFSVRNLFPPMSAFANVTFNIIDVNELPPMFVGSPYAFSVSEDTPRTTTITTFVATDNDAMNRGFIYSLSPGTPALPFMVESNGALVVVGDLDYERTTRYTFQITVSDSPGPGMSAMLASAMVTITILDRNDNPPVFLNTPYNVSVEETAINGFIILSFSSEDRDSQANSVVQYSAQGLTGTPFCLATDDMNIVVCNASLLTSIERDMVFVITLVATNPPGPGSSMQQSTSENVTITLDLVNEFDPEVTSESVNHTGYHEEACGRTTCIGISVFNFSSISSDADGGAGGILTYSLGTSDVPFSLNSLSGELVISERIDREVESLYSLVILVSDGGDLSGNIRSTPITINIPIYDIDDNPPQIVQPFVFNVTEEMTQRFNEVFGQVNVTDPDINGTRVYRVMSFTDPPLSSGCLTSVGRTHPDYLPINLGRITGDLSFCEPVNFEEDRTVFDIRVRVIDSGLNGTNRPVTYTVDQTITVNVVDSNDNTPFFPPGQNFDFSIGENEAAGAIVGSVTANDIDSGLNSLLVFSVVNGSTMSQCSEAVPFFAVKINDTTANIIQCQGLDYEAQQVYTFDVQVRDSAAVPMSSTMQISVRVLDRNDNPPVFDADSYTARVFETDSSLMMSQVVIVTVFDRDSPPNSQSTFNIISPQPSPFGLRGGNGSSVEVFVENPEQINFESDTTMYVVTVQALNSPAVVGDDIQLANTTVLISVLDVNDNAPTIMEPFALEVRENQPAGTSIGRVNARDSDTGIGGQLNFFISMAGADQSCSQDIPFMINTTSGEVTTCQPLDYESLRTYRFLVIVCDLTDPPICSNRTFTVNIIDLNDNAPIFDEDPFVANLNELSPNRTRVDLITSTDGDSQNNSIIAYSSLNTNLPFVIVGNEVLFDGDSTQLDFEGPIRAFIINIRGENPPHFSDDVTQTVDVALVINIVDRNDNPPIFVPDRMDSAEISEHSSVGMIVYELNSTDEDTLANSNVSYSIVTPNSPFTIQGRYVVVRDSEAIDYDPPLNVRNYMLAIRATNPPAAADDQTQTANFTLLVSVNDTNDNFPNCTGSASFILPEDSPINSRLAQLSAEDIDSGMNGNQGIMFFPPESPMGDPLCSQEEPFSIDPDSGAISICTPFDYERQMSYEVNFTVCDGGRPMPLCTTCPVVFLIRDINDNAPVVNPPTNFSVSELTAVDSIVGCVDADDADSGQNAVLEYRFASTVDDCTFTTPFSINESTGCIAVCLSLDYETIQTYSFEIVVSDRGSPQLLNITTFTANVVNENDHIPEITSSNLATVVENLPNELVIRVTSQDIDLPPFNVPSYSLLDDAGGNFTIDSMTGAITTSRALDREQQQDYSLMVQVSDGLNMDTQTLVVTLLDVNDNPPEYQGDDTFTFREEFIFETVLVFRDIDAGINANLTYSVNDARFDVDDNGVLRNLDGLDRDPMTGGSPQVDLIVTASDRSSQPLEQSVPLTIRLTDINDNDPSLADIMGDIIDGSRIGTIVGTARGEDADEGINALLRYSLDGISDTFEINETTGDISLIRNIFITSSTAEMLTVTVIARDSGVPMRSNSTLAVFFVISSRPQFPRQIYTFNIAENRFSYEIGVISAMDRDINQFNDVFEFSIVLVVPYDPGFTVISEGPNGTLVSPANYLDFEDTSFFNITLGVGRVNMSGIIDDSATVMLTLNESNDNVPRLSPMNISAQLMENSPVDTVIARAIAIDFDAGQSGVINYNLSGSGADLFYFRSNGDLVLREERVNFEETSSYTFAYQACDNGSPVQCSEVGTISIQVADVDDLPPVFFPTSYSADIREGFGTERLVFSVNITDADTPFADLTFSLRPPQTSFRIVPLSNVGALFTTAIPLDRESVDLYQFSVVARDPAGSEASASITIRILDDNDERPAIEPATGLVVEFLEEGPEVLPGANLTIIDGDTLSTFPLTQVVASLQQDPTSSRGYPNPGGICDHANYSLLYDNNSHSLCGQDGCLYLLREGQLDLRDGSALENGIMELPVLRSTSRNAVQLLNGQQFVTFTITFWVQFPARTSGNIYEVQSAGNNVFEMFVDGDGSLRIIIRTSPTDSETLISTGTLPIFDGEWHQIAFIRDEMALMIYFDCIEVASGEDNNDISTTFMAGSFFFGNGLGRVFISEFYFCSLVTVSNSHICCTLSCGESLDIDTPTPGINVTVDSRTRSVTLTYSGTAPEASLATLQEALANITYSNQVSEPHPLDRGFRVVADDDVGVSDNPAVVILRPILLNDRSPVFDLNGTALPGINFVTSSDETSPSTAILGEEAFLYDSDSGYWPIASIQVSLIQDRGHILEVPSTSRTLHTLLTNGSRTLLVTPVNPQQQVFPEEYISLLHQVRYINMQEEQTIFDAVIRFRVEDVAGDTNDPISISTITVVPTNDRPSLDLDTTNPNSLNSSVAFMENRGSVNILMGTNQAIIDSDSSQLSQANISFTLRPDGLRESLRLGQSRVQVTSSNFNPSTGTLTITHTASFSDWLDILRSVQYVNTEQTPSDVDLRQVVVVVQDDGGAFSAPAYVTISLTSENDPPELYLGGSNIRDVTLDFTEDGPCVPLAPNLRLFEPDSTGIQFVQIDLSGNNVNRQLERIDYNGSRPSGFVELPTGVLLFLGPSMNSPANYEAELRNFIYCNREDEPNEVGGRSVSFTAIDTGFITARGLSIGPASSVPSTAFINIIRLNDRPAVSFRQLDDVSIRNTPTPIINSSTIVIDDSDDSLFDILRIYITNPQDGSENEIIEFARQLPESSISVGPTDLPGPQILYTVTFTGGADVNRVTETISQLRYNNRALDLTVLPPRQVCVELRDFKIFSLLSCVNVTISPPNNFAPVFVPGVTSYDFVETTDPITIATLRATDADSGREGTVVYSIEQVLSRIGSRVDVTTSIFSIDSSSGLLSAPSGLDVEQYASHVLTLLASDQGNPVMTASIEITVTVQDTNDMAPIFLGTMPFVAEPEREALTPPNVIFTVRAIDRDLSASRIRYGLENDNDKFRIDPDSGVIEYYVTLDAEEQQTYVLNVSASDSGNPPLASYTTVSFSLIDTNDNAATVDQLTPAVYVIGGNPASIGPAIRITDLDLDPPAISSISISLTASVQDLSRTYDQCLVQCQDARLQEAGLLPPAIDLLNAATFNSVGNSRTTIGSANCPAVTLERGTTIATDGFGEIPRNSLPADFAAGEFSISFVLTQRSEGFVILIPDQTDRSLPSSAVEREFGFWIRRRDIRLYYLSGAARTRRVTTIRLTSADSLTEFFNPTNPRTRHFTLVFRTNPATFTVYIDCVIFAQANLEGDVLTTNSAINVFIGGSRPHPLNGGRLAGQLHGLFYHPTALSLSQITDFCSCGFEALVLPPLPSTISASSTLTNQHNIFLRGVGSSDLIPNGDIITVLRSINYTNQFDSPSIDPSDPTRRLDFTITEETGIVGTRRGSIRLVNSDNGLPVVNLNGFTSQEIDTSATFSEGSEPTLVSPRAAIRRNIDGFIDPTFSHVRVQLTNPQDIGETINATASEFVSVNVSGDGYTLDIVGPGIPREFDSVLQTVRYNNLNANLTTSVQREISYIAFDTEGRRNLVAAFSRVSLTSLNDPPSLSLTAVGTNLMDVVRFEEGSEGILVAPNITVSDVDDVELVGAVITLTSPASRFDTLSVSDAIITISSNYDASTGVLSLSGRDSLLRYQTVLASVEFQSSDSPFLDSSIESLIRTVTIQVSDGQLNSSNATVQIQFMPNNDPPVITLSNQTIFEDGDNMVRIAPDAEITDSDNRQLLSMTVELVGTLDNNILTTGTQSGNVLRFGQNSVADMVSNLRSISYVNLAPEPSLLARTITIQVCDFSLPCASATITVVIRDNNDNHPMFSRDTYQFNIREDSPQSSTVGSLSASDADVGSTTFRYAAEEPSFRLSPDGSAVHILTRTLLNFEETNSYSFNVTVSDGVNEGVALVVIDVDNVNEAPSLTFNPPNPALFVGPASRNLLFEAQFTISDPDFNDTIPTAFLTLRNVPARSNESLVWDEVPGYSFVETSNKVYRLSGPGDPSSLTQALRNIFYVAGDLILQPIDVRTVAIVMRDASGVSSPEVNITVSLASIPQFSESVYRLNLTEERTFANFLQVQATVESGGDVITYSVEDGRGVMINESTGFLSLVEPVDRETNSTLIINVFATDALPPARTGRAIVNITILDLNDVRPSVSSLTNITVVTNQPISPFASIEVTDPDITGAIETITISILGGVPLSPSPFTGRVCVDERNVVDKMTLVCGGLNNGIVLLENTLRGFYTLSNDADENEILHLRNSSYAVVNTDFSSFSGRISTFTFIFWVRAESSGYIAYFGTPDSVERYFALYYGRSNNQLIVTVKREGVPLLRGQIRINFQLTTSLSDGAFHLIMLQYSANNLVCIVDGQLVNSVAVVYKDQPFIGQVFGKLLASYMNACHVATK